MASRIFRLVAMGSEKQQTEMNRLKYIAYEKEKAKLEKLKLTPEEYERAIRELTRKLRRSKEMCNCIKEAAATLKRNTL